MSDAVSIQSLAKLSQEAVPENNPVVIAVQTFGDFLGFNPHCHILVTDGCFYGKTKSDLKLGICGERGGDPNSIELCKLFSLQGSDSEACGSTCCDKEWVIYDDRGDV
jgi:Putative transposase.